MSHIVEIVSHIVEIMFILIKLYYIIINYIILYQKVKKSKKVSKKIVYTSGEGSDIKKSKKVSKKNSLHFWGRVWHEKVKKVSKKNSLHFWGRIWHGGGGEAGRLLPAHYLLVSYIMRSAALEGCRVSLDLLPNHEIILKKHADLRIYFHIYLPWYLAI